MTDPAHTQPAQSGDGRSRYQHQTDHSTTVYHEPVAPQHPQTPQHTQSQEQVQESVAQPQQPPQQDQTTQQVPPDQAQYAAEQAAQQQADPNYDPNSDPAAQAMPDYLKPEQEELIFEWEALSRPYRKHNKTFFTTIITIAALVTLIMIFSNQWQLAAVILAIGFLGYVMMVVPPHKTINQITSFGIRTEDQLYFWEEMGRFWFEVKAKSKVVNIEVSIFPYRIQLVLGDIHEEEMRNVLSVVLLEGRPPLTLYEKFTQWWQEKIPLDFES